MCHCWRLVVTTIACVSVNDANSQCDLPNAVPPDKRVNIVIDGVDMPIGVVLMDWTSARLGAHMIKFLIETQLGYNVVFSATHDNAIQGVRALGGCSSEDASLATDVCQPIAARSHIVWEVWGGANIPMIDRFLKSMRDRAPDFVGECGFGAVEGLYIWEDQEAHILAKTGLPTLFYQTWNATWHDFAPYFSSLLSIAASDMMPCNESRIMWSDDIHDYFTTTGDASGTWEVDGKLVGKCAPETGDVWWLAPACRDTPGKCIPCITGGTGWHLDVLMQKSAIFNMPLAVGVAANWNKYMEISRGKIVLQYYWEPDGTFIDLRPKRVLFPPHDKAAWNIGKKITAQEGVKLMKYLNSEFKEAANQIVAFFTGMQLSQAALSELFMMLHQDGSTEQDVVCKFLQQNGNVWSGWIPDGTRCSKRWGLIDLNGEFVDSREAASSCAWCPPGRFSLDLEDDIGITHWCKPCAVGTMAFQFGALKCSDCPVGKFSADLGRATCTNCPVGSFAGEIMKTACASCVAGQFGSKAGMSECLHCPVGTFAHTVGRSTCEECAAGSHIGVGLKTECVQCERGKYNAALGMSKCLACRTGKYAALFGHTDCLECPIGTYSNTTGQSGCTSCDRGKTTMRKLRVGHSRQWIHVGGSSSQSYCTCEFGYRPHMDTCIPCEQDGLVCEGETRIQAGYYADVDFEVFECRPSTRCKGGVVGATCELGRQAIACAECQSGMTPTDGGKCIACEESDLAPILIGVAVAILVLGGMYHTVDSRNLAGSPHSFLLVATAGGQLIAMMQLFSVIGNLLIPFPEPLDVFLRIMSPILFELEVLRIDCVIHLPPMMRFILDIAVIFFVSLLLFIIHVLFVVFRHEGEFTSRFSTLVALVGMIFSVFLISVVSVVVSPLQCDAHPNQRWTVRKYGSVLCWESSVHKVMLIVGMISLFVPLGFVAACVKVVLQYPSRIHTMDTGFLQNYAFLFARVNPDVYWYSLVLMTRSLLVALVPTVPDVALQILVVQLLLILLLTITFLFQPWRLKTNNHVDMAAYFTMILFMTHTALFVNAKNVDKVALSWSCMVGLSSLVLGIANVIFYGLIKPYAFGTKTYQFFLCHHKVGAGAYTRMLKMCLLEQRRVRRRVFIDCDDLRNLDTLFDIVGHDVENFVVIASKSIFVRPWCVGEITTAHCNKISIRMIRLPEFAGLELEVIDNWNHRKVLGTNLLAKSGISAGMVKAALHFVQTLLAIIVPPSVSSDIMTSLASSLVAGIASCNIGETSAAKVRAKSVILCETSILEASAAAYVLQKMLVAENVPVGVVHQPGTIPTEATQAIIIFSHGCLERMYRRFPMLLIEAAHQRLRVLPVLSVEGFRVPTAQILHEMRDNPIFPELETEPGEMALILTLIFKQIAKEFPVAEASEEVLKTLSRMIAERLTDGLDMTILDTSIDMHSLLSTTTPASYDNDSTVSRGLPDSRLSRSPDASPKSWRNRTRTMSADNMYLLRLVSSATTLTSTPPPSESGRASAHALKLAREQSGDSFFQRATAPPAEEHGPLTIQTASVFGLHPDCGNCATRRCTRET